MEQDNRCAECGTPLPADAPHGLCPSCVLGQALVADSLEAGRSGDQATLPTAIELGASFPELDILELIGRGGMGAVYKARQKQLDRLVALKILPPKVRQDPAFAERFAREAKALARLNHPHIVAVYDSGQASPIAGQTPGDSGLFYFLMEYVDGMNLRQFMAHRPIPVQQSLSIILQVCQGLQYAHKAGVVHRDIKPDNILLDKDANVKLVDFGMAMLACDTPTDLTLTEPGSVMGTVYYMAPEQLEHPGEVDHRADIYSTGVVLYQLLTGELPIGRFVRPSLKASSIDPRLNDLVLKTLEKDPQQRYQRIGDLMLELETIAQSAFSPSEALATDASLPPDAPPAAQQFTERTAWLPLAAIAAVVLLLVLGATAYVLVGLKGMLTPKASTSSPIVSPPAKPAGVSSSRAPLGVAVPPKVLPARKWTANKTPLAQTLGRSTDELRQIIAEGDDVNEQSRDGSGAPLHMAAGNGDRLYTAAQLLVEAGADVNAPNHNTGLTPLMLAAANNGAKLTEYLLSKGADINATDQRGRRALDFAEYHKHEAVIAILKQAGAKTGTGVHVTPKPPLPGAVRAPVQAEAVPATLPSAAATRPSRSSLVAARGPLIQALMQSDVGSAKQAIADGADVNFVSTDGNNQTALLYAVQCLNDDHALEIVRLLIDKGADVNSRTDRSRQTAIMTTVFKRMHKTTAYLLSHGADVNLADSAGRTALSRAYGLDDVETIASLKAAGVKTGPAPREPVPPEVEKTGNR